MSIRSRMRSRVALDESRPNPASMTGRRGDGSGRRCRIRVSTRVASRAQGVGRAVPHNLLLRMPFQTCCGELLELVHGQVLRAAPGIEAGAYDRALEPAERRVELAGGARRAAQGLTPVVEQRAHDLLE